MRTTTYRKISRLKTTPRPTPDQQQRCALCFFTLLIAEFLMLQEGFLPLLCPVSAFESTVPRWLRLPLSHSPTQLARQLP